MAEVKVLLAFFSFPSGRAARNALNVSASYAPLSSFFRVLNALYAVLPHQSFSWPLYQEGCHGSMSFTCRAKVQEPQTYLTRRSLATIKLPYSSPLGDLNSIVLPCHPIFPSLSAGSPFYFFHLLPLLLYNGVVSFFWVPAAREVAVTGAQEETVATFPHRRLSNLPVVKVSQQKRFAQGRTSQL